VSHPLLVGLITHLMQPRQDLETFEDLLLDRLFQLHGSSDYEELDWYPELYTFWESEYEDVDDLLPEFEHLVDAIYPLQLCDIAIDIRNQLLLEASGTPTYPLRRFVVTYSVEWADGMVSDYCCRPVTPGITLTPSVLSDLTRVCQQHLADYLHRPGLDGMHDQAAKPFDRERFDELLRVMQGYSDSRPATEREAYDQVIQRIRHVCGESPAVEPPDDERPELEWLNNGGGF